MEAWPALDYTAWRPTKETLHRYLQVVGKTRLALEPRRNHWWHVTSYVATRGITTGPVPAGDHDVEVLLDVLASRLAVTTSAGFEGGFAIEDGLSVADFTRRLFATLASAGVEVTIDPAPFDLDGPPLDTDDTHRSYDADAVARWWTVLRGTDHVLRRFAGGFVGKASPTHLFWHSFDLAHTRFSGRRATLPDDVDAVTREAYSHEVISFGFWTGQPDLPEAAYYSYTAPEPDRLTEEPLEPERAWWQTSERGSLALLRYADVRSAPDPAAALLAFFTSAYTAGATAADWASGLTVPADVTHDG